MAPRKVSWRDQLTLTLAETKALGPGKDRGGALQLREGLPASPCDVDVREPAISASHEW